MSVILSQDALAEIVADSYQKGLDDAQAEITAAYQRGLEDAARICDSLAIEKGGFCSFCHTSKEGKR